MIVIAANPYRGAERPRARVEALVTALQATGAAVQVIWDAAHRTAREAPGRCWYPTVVPLSFTAQA